MLNFLKSSFEATQVPNFLFKEENLQNRHKVISAIDYSYALAYPNVKYTCEV